MCRASYATPRAAEAPTRILHPMAVYTEVTDEELARFIESYGLGELLSYKGIAEGVENTNYVVHPSRGHFILTLYEKRVAPGDLPFFLGLMDHLAHRGVPCPTPVHGRDGAALRHLCGRPAALVSFLKGGSARRIRLEHCGALGGALARLHLAGADFAMQRDNALSLAGWRTLFEACRARADQVLPGLEAELEDELRTL